jgi:hypothetical protein
VSGSGGLPATAAGWRVRLADWRGRGVYAGYPNQHRCIFIHSPKTAGSSVARALFGVDSRHVPCTDYRAANPEKFARFFKFAFVRNPWDRLVSTYAFLRDGGMNEMDRQWAREHLAPYADFDDFVRRGLALEAVRSWVHFRPQTDFICDADGKILMDFVGRYERLDEDFAVVAKTLHRNVALPVTNVSRRSGYVDYYTAETRDLVGRLYGSDVAAFDYGFGS